MSDSIEDLVEKYGDVSLPLSVRFKSNVVRLDEIDSKGEQNYRARSYYLEKLEGKTGSLFLGDSFLSKVMIEENGSAVRILDKDAGTVLQEAASEALMKVAAMVGRAYLASDVLSSGLKPGSLIALDREADAPDMLIVSDNGCVIGQGEAVTIEAEFCTFGLRLKSIDGGKSIKPAGGKMVTGDLLLGEIQIEMENLGRMAEETILNMGTNFTPIKMFFSNGSSASGYLQFFLKEDLEDSKRLINSIPETDGERVLAFCVTSETGLAPAGSFASSEADSDTAISLEAVFSVLDDEKIGELLSTLDYNTLAWVLKSSAYEGAAGILSRTCLSLGEEKGSALLDSFIQCNPDNTPVYAAAAVCASIVGRLDDESLAAVVESGKGGVGSTSPGQDPVESAANVIKTVESEDLKTMLEWYEIHYPAAHANLKQYL